MLYHQGNRTGRSRLLAPPVLMIMVLAAALVPPSAAAAAAQTISSVSTSQPVVLLTFDTDSVRGYSDSVLNTLEAKGVRASFGVTGVFARNNPDVVQRMVRGGHTLINHSNSHPDFTRISPAQRAAELRAAEDAIRSVAGVEAKPFFRPPYGAYNGSVLSDLGAHGYGYNVMWSIDPQGWRGKSSAEITRLVLAGARPGAIVLMHTTTAGDASALPGIIDALRARGYGFATVGDFLAPAPPPPPPPEYRYFPETGNWVSHGFLRYWERFGGLAVFGYPLTEEFVDPDTGVTTQYFERARFEWHPGAWPERYDVLLGLLGREVTAGREGEPPFSPVVAASDASTTYYPQTGHRLSYGFRAFWHSHGGLEIFGYPISEEFVENGRTVQYFERARFEWHPENPPDWQVLGGLLGRQVLDVRMSP